MEVFRDRETVAQEGNPPKLPGSELLLFIFHEACPANLEGCAPAQPSPQLLVEVRRYCETVAAASDRTTIADRSSQASVSNTTEEADSHEGVLRSILTLVA